MVIHDLRIPFDEQLPVHVGGFRHVRRQRIAVVVVADIFLIQARNVVQRALFLVRLAHVPVGDQFLPVGIGEHAQQNRIVQQAHGFRISAADHLINHFDFLLRADGLRGVQASIDPHHGLAFPSQRACGVPGHLRVGQALRDFAVMLQVLDVRGRADDGHPLMAALGGLKLRVAGHVVIVADVESERLLRSRVLRSLREQGACEQKKRNRA